MNPPMKELEDSRLPSSLPELDVLRHWTAPAIDLSRYPLPNHAEEQITLETKQEMESLNERYRLEGREASEQESDQIQLAVRERHQKQYSEGVIKFALWRESERILRILRTKGLGPVLDESTFNQHQLEYIRKLDLKCFPEANPNSLLFIGADPSIDKWFTPPDYPDVKLPSLGIGPNEYFALTCPELVANFGYPFHISIYQRLVGINTDFFAAYLGGQKRFYHRVVFYVPEARFYFLDPQARQYIPTTEQKMRIWLSLVLQERAWGVCLDHATTILTQYRSNDVMDEILRKAKSLLAAERGYFKDNETHPRFVVEESGKKDLQVTVRLFLEAQVCLDEKSILRVTDFMDGLKNYLRTISASLPKHQELKTIVQANMREIHHKGLRNDLILADGGFARGWKGLRLRDQTQTDGVPFKELPRLGLPGPSGPGLWDEAEQQPNPIHGAGDSVASVPMVERDDLPHKELLEYV